MRWIALLIIALVITTAHWFFAPGASYGTYLIKLKNGREFIASRYWQEGQQIMFDTYGGVFGIEKEFVKVIEKSDKPVKPTAAAQEVPEEKTQRDSSEKKEVTEPSSAVGEKPKAKPENDPIIKEFNELKERAQGLQGLLTSEIRELLQEITVFKKKLSSSSKFLIDYSREYNDIHEISSSVETALRARTQ